MNSSDKGRFKGKVVLVTGGSRNTGLEIVDLFLEEGAEVFFCGRVDSINQGVAELKRRGRVNFTAQVCDVSKKEDVASMMDAIAAKAGRLDIVVSNAVNFGIGHGTALEMTEAQFLDVLNTNVLGAFRVVQGAANRFFTRQERDAATQERGVVVFVGSNTSERVSRKRLAYCASKGAMDAMVRALGVDFGPLGIRVNMVAPGYIFTDRWNWLSDEVRARRRANLPTGREASGRDVAEAVAYLASPGACACQGARLVMDGGASAQLYPESCEDDTSVMREK